MKLPVAFTDRMKKLLVEEYENFIATYDREHYKGIRINALKVSVNEFLDMTSFDLKPIPWIQEGFYLNDANEQRPGKHPYYHCGLYYIQEPSAMIPVQVLDPRPGDKVLDISAAPGGKATQIGAKLKNEGILVANDISPKRVRPLAKNIELFGIKNCIVTNETPEKLSYKFVSFFDKILVDAPCSGEGMFKRDPKAPKSWSQFSVDECYKIQRDILKSISIMLKPGGRLVYSTCTFSPEENEGTIEWLLNEFPEFEVEEITNIEGLEGGRPEWINAREDIRKTGRAWPHKIDGDGHFVASLRKKSGKNSKNPLFKKEALDIEEFLLFETGNLNIKFREGLSRIGNRLFVVPNDLPDLSGIKVVSFGLYLGEFLKGRFEPSQALAMALKQEEVINTINFQSNSIEAIKYLKGETILADGDKGWKLVCIDGYPVGWAKQVEGSLKNHYEAEWRMK